MDTSVRSQPKIFYGWYIVATCFFVAFLIVGARNCFGIFVIPMSEELGWNRTTISFAAALGFLVNGMTQPFIGYMFDRLGGRRVITTGLAIMGVAAVCLSFTFHHPGEARGGGERLEEESKRKRRTCAFR